MIIIFVYEYVYVYNKEKLSSIISKLQNNSYWYESSNKRGRQIVNLWHKTPQKQPVTNLRKTSRLFVDWLVGNVAVTKCNEWLQV